MLSQIVLCLMAIFSVIGLIYILESIFCSCDRQGDPYIIIGVKDRQDSIEGQIRTIMKQHPKSEIMIIDYDSSDDTKTIIEKLKKDYRCIHTKSFENIDVSNIS